ncbi:MAG: DUF2344 domain-containing protein [Clostridia bacterium]|nr:DUF2344 domain-containing protein [Clostridia bacterium]
MQPPVKYTLRIFWQKKGNSKYVSHLDTQRAVVRALIRSGLPLYYSQGFNPHPKLVFALPVSIFQEALYDVFDIDITERISPKRAAEMLGAVMPGDTPVIGAAYPVKKFKELYAASYLISLDTDLKAAEVEKALRGEVVVEKKSKKKCEMTDISPMIYGVSAVDTDRGVILKATLSAAPDAYLNPKYLVDFLGDKVRFSETVREMLFDKEMQPLK